MWLWFALVGCTEGPEAAPSSTGEPAPPTQSQPRIGISPLHPEPKILAIVLLDPVDQQPLGSGDEVLLHWPQTQPTGDLGYALSVTGSHGTVAIAPTVVRLDDGSDITNDNAERFVQLVATGEECAFTEEDSAALLVYGALPDFETLDGVRLRLTVEVTDLETGQKAEAEIEVVGVVSIETE